VSNNEEKKWDKETQHDYNQSQIHLMQFQYRAGVIVNHLQYATWAKAFALLAHRDIEGLREEVERLANDQLAMSEQEQIEEALKRR